MPANRKGRTHPLDSPRARAPDRTEDIIGENLRRVYDEVAKEPLPDRLAELLEKLKKGDSNGPS